MDSDAQKTTMNETRFKTAPAEFTTEDGETGAADPLCRPADGEHLVRGTLTVASLTSRTSSPPVMLAART